MTAAAQTLLPRRDSGGAALLAARTVEVHHQEQLLNLPSGVLPALRGDATFALGAGAAALARDSVRVCAVEGAAVLASDRVQLVVWDGAACGVTDDVELTVGAGGRAWVRSDGAQVRCQAAPAGLVVDEDTADLEVVVHGRSTLHVDAGRVTAGGGAHVTASGRATLLLDRSVTGRDLDGRLVSTTTGPELPPPDPTDELSAHVTGAQVRAVHPARRVLLPWLPPGAAASALLEPVLEALVATGMRPSGGWVQERGRTTATLRGRLDWPSLQARLALPPSVGLQEGPDGPRVVSDLDVQIRFRRGLVR